MTHPARKEQCLEVAPPPPEITLRVGQIVPLPAAPDGFGQVAELLRTNVVVLYARSGRLCRRKVPAWMLGRLCSEQPLLPGLADNPFARGICPRAKTFSMEPLISNRPPRRPGSAT